MSRHLDTPQSVCRFSLAQTDITPPVGIYHRLWGAATHDRSTGVHRPLRGTVMLFQPEGQPDVPPQVLLAVDLCFLAYDVLNDMLPEMSRRTGIPREHFLFSPSHTHSAGYLDYSRESLPGGDLIRPYFKRLAEQFSELVNAAKENLEPATLVYGVGHCGLGTHRDFWDHVSKQYVCGFHPEGTCDTRVVVARVTDAKGKELATIANYACHPTTIAWQSSLIGPDYIGAFREVVEEHTGAPCVFLQGASGDVGPKDGFVGDHAVADRNGRQLAFAVLEAWTGLRPAGTRFAYAGPVVSGATLGTWKDVPLPAADLQRQAVMQVEDFTVNLAYRPELPTREQVTADRGKYLAEEQAATKAGDLETARDAHALVERMDRQLARMRVLPEGKHYPFPVRLWKLGDAVWVFVESEPYNYLQRELRARFPNHPIVVNTLINAPRTVYLPTEPYYNTGVYQESIACVAAGSLELLTARIGDRIAAMLLT